VNSQMVVENLENDVRREVRRAYYADGLFDLVYGLGIVFISMMVLSEIAISLWFLPVLYAIVVLPAAKKRWVQPRVGYVKPGRPTRTWQGLMAALTALLLAGVLITALSGRGEQSPLLQGAYRVIGWVMSRFGLLIGLIAGAATAWNGYSLGLKRLMGYGGGMALAGALSTWRGLGVALPVHLAAPERSGALFFALLGLAMAGVGAALFGRFVREHPLQREEA